MMTAASNVFAQSWTAYSNKVCYCHRLQCPPTSNTLKTLSTVDVISLLRFIFLAVLTTPLNYQWQKYLEDSYPTREAKIEKHKQNTKIQEEPPLSVTNTAIKFVLDQSIGCWTNTIIFIVTMGILKGQSIGHIMSIIETDFWSMVMAGYKLWPMVCLLNLLVVPFDYRMLVGNLAGFGWGVYVSLTT